MGLATVGVLVAALLSVNVVVWARTSDMRSGRPERGPVRSGFSRTSAFTCLAGLAGVAVAGAGIGILAERPGWLGLGVAGAGTFVAVAGLAARVSGLDVTDVGLTVHYAARRPFSLSWTECLELRAPRTPLGGWRVTGSVRSITLMPSDVLGLEWVLREIVVRAALSYDGGAWSRPAWVSPTA
jgi:hypothetical protein